MSREGNAIAEGIEILRRMWNHRKFTLKIRNKQLINIDHTIPGLVQDTIDAIWGTRERDLRPLIIKKHQKEGGTGWDLVIYLPPGISYRDFYNRLHYFQDATGGAVEIKKQGRAAVMTVLTDELKRFYPYKWHDLDFPCNAWSNETKYLPFPVGHSAAGFIEADLTEFPNLLVAGHPGAGKSNLLHVILVSLLILSRGSEIWPVVIDLKRTEYGYLDKYVLLIEDLPNALQVLKAINKELDKRAGVLKQHQMVRNQDFKYPMPWIVLVIDELAELQDKECQESLNRIVRLGRAPGICVVAATQRPSSTMFEKWGDSKAMFPATICFKVRDELNSRMILDNDRAAHIPEIPGRAIFQWDRELEVQVPYLPISKAKKILKEFVSTLEKREVIFDVTQLTPKRLPPRQGHRGRGRQTPVLEHRPDIPPVF